MEVNNLFEELLAISLVDIEKCKKDKIKRQYLEELILDFYDKVGCSLDTTSCDAWPFIERDRIKLNIARDTSLSMQQKMILYNNFSESKIRSLSQFRRLMIQRKNDDWW